MSQTILVADDDEGVRLVIEETLKEEGFAVVTAQNGEECVSMAAEHRPDLILLDLNMPVVGGIEALRRLRGSPETKAMPIIILTGQADFTSLVDGWTSGANQYLRKPVSRATLLNEIRRLLPPEPAAKST